LTIGWRGGGFPDGLADAALAHAKGDKVEAAWAVKAYPGEYRLPRDWWACCADAAPELACRAPQNQRGAAVARPASS
jgi:hypothetical protein